MILSLSCEEEKSQNPMHMKMKTKMLSLVLIPVLAYFSASPTSQAVNPPPDGGYPGFNTAEGQNALFGLTTGVANTGVGWYSLWSNTDGSYNTAVGAGTLLFNIGDQTTFEGVDNTAVGAAALLFNTTGTDNTATGAVALLNNTGGSNNTATGSFALQSNTTGNLNTATGLSALHSNTTGIGNTAVGGGALALNTTGGGNTAIGTGTLSSNTTGNANIAIGGFAGHALTTGDQNIVIGNPNAVAGESNTIRIGGNSQTRAFIAGIRGVATGNNDAVNVVIDSDGQLGTVSSSRRFKKEIKPMDTASDAILALKPVTFHYKADTKSTPQFGLIAEEVAKVNSDLVVRDKKGEIYTVRYDAVNAMLLNEFLKEHHKNEEQEATIAQLKRDSAEQRKQIETLTAGLQKVSGQLELSQPAPRTVVSN
jgi:Chaperone of endosialidase